MATSSPFESASIPAGTLQGKAVAAFDTRIQAAEVGKALRQFMKIGGYAAPRIARALGKKGGNPAAPPEGFFVVKKEGPLVEGELERAAAWAKGIAASPAPNPGRTIDASPQAGRSVGSD